MHIRVMLKPDWLAGRPSARWDCRIADDLLENAIRLDVLSEHYVNPEAGEQGFLLGFSNPAEATMSLVVQALADWFERQSG